MQAIHYCYHPHHLYQSNSVWNVVNQICNFCESSLLCLRFIVSWRLRIKVLFWYPFILSWKTKNVSRLEYYWWMLVVHILFTMFINCTLLYINKRDPFSSKVLAARPRELYYFYNRFILVAKQHVSYVHIFNLLIFIMIINKLVVSYVIHIGWILDGTSTCFIIYLSEQMRHFSELWFVWMSAVRGNIIWYQYKYWRNKSGKVEIIYCN